MKKLVMIRTCRHPYFTILHMYTPIKLYKLLKFKPCMRTPLRSNLSNASHLVNVFFFVLARRHLLHSRTDPDFSAYCFVRRACALSQCVLINWVHPWSSNPSLEDHSTGGSQVSLHWISDHSKTEMKKSVARRVCPPHSFNINHRMSWWGYLVENSGTFPALDRIYHSLTDSKKLLLGTDLHRHSCSEFTQSAFGHW